MSHCTHCHHCLQSRLCKNTHTCSIAFAIVGNNDRVVFPKFSRTVDFDVFYGVKRVTFDRLPLYLFHYLVFVTSCIMECSWRWECVVISWRNVEVVSNGEYQIRVQTRKICSRDFVNLTSGIQRNILNMTISLFTKIKMGLKYDRFDTVEDILTNATA